MMATEIIIPKAIELKDGELWLIDQRKLPQDEIWEKQTTIEQVWDSIKTLKVRGAPAIGIAGAYGLCIGLIDDKQTFKTPKDLLKKCKAHCAYLNSSRPTAVNLDWALSILENLCEELVDQEQSIEPILQRLWAEAENIHKEDQDLCHEIGKHALTLIQDGMTFLTHCNAGAMATGGSGTALSGFYQAKKLGKNFKVFSCETRPLLQGSRITCWELKKAQIDATLITDSMAAHFMSKQKIDVVITGADRVARNGDAANKIGTLSHAIAAKHFNIPFYIACPFSTLDLSLNSGKEIPIELRDPNEVSTFNGNQSAPQNMKAENPAFDVTPASLITGIITEKGIFRPPFTEAFEKHYD